MGNEVFMKGDDAYNKDINRANTPDEIMELSQRARDRSLGVTRNPITGQFENAVRDAAEQEAARDAASNVGGHTYTKTVTIGGKEIEFSDADPERLDRAIQHAQQVAEILQAPSSQEQDKQADSQRQQRIQDRAELDRQLRLGIITTADYLQKSGAVGEYLEAQGVSLEVLRERSQQEAAAAYQQSWAQATEAFLAGPGASWPGGDKNLKQINLAVQALGLMDAEDKVAALVQAYDYLKKAGTLFARDTSEEDAKKFTSEASPQEILEAWKRETFGNDAFTGDASRANDAFIRAFRRRG